MRDRDDTAAGWRSWRFELTAHGKYVELSFDGVRLANRGDVDRWARELEVALDHYRRPVDMLIDLRGVRVMAEVGRCCRERLDEILERHARALAFFGADATTESVLAPCLAAHGGGRGWPERAMALRWLMERRRAGRAARGRDMAAPMPAVPVRARTWEESGAVSL